MKGVIHNYRRARHHQNTRQLVIYPDGVSSKEEAEKLVGKEVVWHTGKRDMKGTVSAAHGSSGAVRVRFETGMPGQSIGQTVEIK